MSAGLQGRRGRFGAGGSAVGVPAGRDSSQDEQGACALLGTQLSALLGERPVTHREAQGHESDTFMGHFPRGVTYQVRALGTPWELRVLGVPQGGSASLPSSQHPQ